MVSSDFFSSELDTAELDAVVAEEGAIGLILIAG